MDIYLLFIGILTGFLVGSTGVAGASLLAPLLISYGVPTTQVVGTDLLYNTITKLTSSYIHFQKGNINKKILIILFSGSIPGVIIVGILINTPIFKTNYDDTYLKSSIGIIILITVSLNLIHLLPNKIHVKFHSFYFSNILTNVNVIRTISLFLGGVVCLTSIGAGSLFALLLLKQNLKTSEIVGTDIIHACIISGLSSLFHFYTGNINFVLLFNLLLGAIPSVIISSHLTNLIPDFKLRLFITFILLITSLKLIF